MLAPIEKCPFILAWVSYETHIHVVSAPLYFSSLFFSVEKCLLLLTSILERRLSVLDDHLHSIHTQLQEAHLWANAI